MHDYGLKKNDILAAGVRYRRRPFKKVLLTNVNAVKNRITVDKVEKHLKNSLGLAQWERKQAIWLVEAIVEAIEKGEKTADITKMFSCEFFTEDDEVLIQRYIQNELMYRLFFRVEETEDVLKLKLNWKVIFM